MTMAQVGEAHIDTCNFLQTRSQYLVYLLNNDLKWLELISDHIHVWKCVSATSAIGA